MNVIATSHKSAWLNFTPELPGRPSTLCPTSKTARWLLSTLHAHAQFCAGHAGIDAVATVY